MATFKAELQDKKKDGTYNVKIRIYHNGDIRRLSTNLFVSSENVTRSLKIKDEQIINECNTIVKKCREYCNSLGFSLNTMTIDDLKIRIKKHLEGGEGFRLDFIEYTRNKASKMKESTGKLYINTLNSLIRFIKRDYLDISEININFLKQYESFLEIEPSMRGNNRKNDNEKIIKKGGRAISAYIGCVKSIHNKAKEEFNDEDRGIILIPYSPFNKFKIKPQPKTRKRALSVDLIQKIINIPYEKENSGIKLNRFNLAKDCFILSFALIGMNSADMFYCLKPIDGVITYNRRKTVDRRDDRAEMKVKIEDIILKLIAKYEDADRLFNFHKKYKDTYSFNRSINKGLKQIGERLSVEDLTFYAARHSWATVARSNLVGIDKLTIHEALNHVDSSMKVTDIYIDKDWSNIWEANTKVLSNFDWQFII